MTAAVAVVSAFLTLVGLVKLITGTGAVEVGVVVLAGLVCAVLAVAAGFADLRRTPPWPTDTRRVAHDVDDGHAHAFTAVCMLCGATREECSL